MAKAHQIEGIDCQAPANTGIRLVLLERFEELLEFRADALKWEDPEGVHSMRVASRRLRSALRDFTPYIKKRGLATTLTRIKTLAGALGAVRDEDVAIDALQSLSAKTSASVTKTLEHIIKERNQARDEARKELKLRVSKQELRQLNSDFREAISVATYTSSIPRRELSYSEMAREVIGVRLGDFEKLSDTLFTPFDVEGLHELRISGKRLRYAVELFDQCWGSSTMPIAKRIAALQTHLGDIHDSDVWIESFGKRLKQGSQRAEQNDNESCVWLLNHFVKVRMGHLREALILWSEWQKKDIGAKLRDAIKN
jgi:CHAD domain-containing protein